MAQLDRFLAALVSHRASALMLGADVPAQLDMQGTPRAITKTAFTELQLLALLQELAPGNARMSLDAGTATEFSYVSEDGSFDIQVAPRAAGLRAVVRVKGPAAAPPPSSPVSVEQSHDEVGAPGMSPERERIEGLLRMMIQRGSSDLHLRVGEPPIVRVDGEMVRIPDTAVLQSRELEGLVKSIMPERNRGEFESSNDTDFAHDIPGTGRFRCNVMREHKGAAAVFRIIPAKVVSVEQLGITDEVQKLCYLTRGLVLVTGPTGSGKSTTLCSLIDLINRKRSEHVITIEDPIEFVHENKQCIITQRQVGVHTGSFKTALRAALREDPDIVLVGELRDLETVSIAIETAETGHLVFATLHTTSAAGTIDRLIALQEDRWRARCGARGAAHDPVDRESHSRREDLPDRVGDSDIEAAGHGHAQRCADRSRGRGAGRAEGSVHEGERQAGLRAHAAQSEHRGELPRSDGGAASRRCGSRKAGARGEGESGGAIDADSTRLE